MRDGTLDVILEVGFDPCRDWREIEKLLSDYVAKLCEDLDLPVNIQLLPKSSDHDSLRWPESFSIFVNGQTCPLRWWPQPVLPQDAAPYDVAALLATSLYESREFLISRELVDFLAEKWQVRADGRYLNHWSLEGFRSFVLSFLRYNHSLKHARGFVKTCKKGAENESEAACCFERAIEEAEDLDFGLVVTLRRDELEQEYTEKLTQKYAERSAWEEAGTLARAEVEKLKREFASKREEAEDLKRREAEGWREAKKLKREYDLKLEEAEKLERAYVDKLTLEYADKLRFLITQLGSNLGTVLPEVRIETSFEANISVGNPGRTADLEIKLNSVRLPKFRALSPGEWLLFASEAELNSLRIRYRRLLDPVGGTYSFCADQDFPTWEKLRRGGVSVWQGDPADDLTERLKQVLRANAASFFATPIIFLLVEQVRKNAPELIDNLRKKFGGSLPFFYQKLTAILRRLLDEAVPIRDLAGILESLSSLIEVTKEGQRRRIFHYTPLEGSPLPVAEDKTIQELDVDDLAFAARLGVRSLAVKYFRREPGKQILRLSPVLPERPRELQSHVAARIIWATLQTQPNCDFGIIVPQDLRASFRKLLRFQFPTLTVIGSCEVPSEFGQPYNNIKELHLLDLRPDSFRKRRSLYRHFETAIPRMAEAVALSSGDIDLSIAAGVSCVRANRIADGINRLKQAEALTQGNPDCQRAVARGYYAAGRALATNLEYQKALEMLENAVSLDPDVPIYHYDLAQTLEELNEPARAREEYELAAKSSPEDAEWQAATGKVFYDRQAYENAIEHYRRAASLASKNPDYYTWWGHSLYRIGAYGKAIIAYRQAVDRMPEISAYHGFLADALIFQGDYLAGSNARDEHYKDAVKEFCSAIKIDPGTAWYHHHLGWALIRLSKFEEAVAAFRDTIRLDPKNLPAHRDMASCFSKQRKFPEAVQELEKSAKAYPSVLEIQMDLAKAYAQVGQYDKAVTAAETANSKENQPPQASDLVARLRKAKETADKLGTKPENPSLFAALGYVQYRLGNFQAAAEQYRSAVNLDPSKADFERTSH